MSDKILITVALVSGLFAVAAMISMIVGLLLLNLNVILAGFASMVIFVVVCAGAFVAVMAKELYK
jgi:hypothetical protein